MDGPGHDESERGAREPRPPAQGIAEPGRQRAGDGHDEPVVDELHHRDAGGVGGKRDRQSPAERHPGTQDGSDREAVAEQERQSRREHDAHRVGQAERGRQHHSEDLTDSATGEAVQRCTDGLLGQGPLFHRAVIHVVSSFQTAVLRKPRSRRLLLTTNTLDSAIAPPASKGLSKPAAARGRAATL